MAHDRAIHDIVVIGASAGGLEPLQTLLRDLPQDLPASICIVMHVVSPSILPQILGRAAALPVYPAASGEPIEHGRVYVAQPGSHLLLHDGHLLVRRGPRENTARPAIDPLFRSAACSFGARVIGVVLSGALDDGTAGLAAIKRCGGLAVAQDPKDAAVPSMPRSALAHVEVDHCVPVQAMAALLTRLVVTSAGETPPVPVGIRLEAAIAAQETSGMDVQGELGVASPFSCPECNGVLWELNDESMTRFRCHVGHSYTSEAMLAAKFHEFERILLTLLRSHAERAEIIRRMADDARAAKLWRSATYFEERANDYREDAMLLGQLLTRQGTEPNAGDATIVEPKRNVR
jgi:two-component system chemotaxis response regulator CheB